MGYGFYCGSTLASFTRRILGAYIQGLETEKWDLCRWQFGLANLYL